MSRKIVLSLVASMMMVCGASTAEASGESTADVDAGKAVLNARALPTITGDCRVPATGEVVTIHPRDPIRYFGLVGVGQSDAGTTIFLQESGLNEIFIRFGFSSVTYFTVNPDGPTVIRADQYEGQVPNGHWLTCDLQVQLTS